MSVVVAEGLSKSYPRVRALDGLTMSLPGGAVGLLGQNGAGKSTFLKILLGFVQPDAGTVRVMGEDPGRRPLEVRRWIGYMPETEAFIPGASAVDTVYLAARLTGLPHTDALQRTHRVLNFVGLQEERYRDVAGYSTGMKQKVKLAQALVHHPRLLLLDEPTAGLDPRAREEMLHLIRDISHGKGIDVVLSTHILHDVELVCDQAAIIHRGKLVLQDDLRRLVVDGPPRWDVRVKGDRQAYLRALREEGVEAVAGDEAEAVRATAAGSAEPLLRAAARTGVQLRRLAPVRPSLEERFASLVGGG